MRGMVRLFWGLGLGLLVRVRRVVIGWGVEYWLLMDLFYL